jgi:hypothetical protein
MYRVSWCEICECNYGDEIAHHKQLSQSRSSPSFMEPEGALSCSQSPPLVPILSQINPVHNFQPYFPKIHSNMIFPPTYSYVMKLCFAKFYILRVTIFKVVRTAMGVIKLRNDSSGHLNTEKDNVKKKALREISRRARFSAPRTCVCKCTLRYFAYLIGLDVHLFQIQLIAATWIFWFLISRFREIERR